ncbi:MAG: chromate transporter [Clostridia bacterium]|nr:chromate transporter [Clostridia bacterium]
MGQELTRAQKLWKLFVTSLYISAFTFGGGFVIITFMKRKYVDEFHWIDDKEMLDLTALAQTSPGAIAVNAAILVGWRVGGVPGAALAVLGTVIPPVIIILVISLFYAAFAANKYVALVLKGMQAGVAAVILDVVCNLGKKVAERKSLIDLFIVLGAFAATFFFKVNVVFIILIAGLIGVLRATLLKPKGVEK